LNQNVSSYDDSTLFCPAGMQQFKSNYKDVNYKNTLSNIQSCLRLNDIEEIGDGSHLLYFNMIGLFSFRELTIIEAIDIWMKFLNRIGIVPDYVTIHPDKKDWINFYKNYNIIVKFDNECIWSDGEIGGYCTEFYKNNIEIGNIVNTLDNCIDCGFGLERIEIILGNYKKSKREVLEDTIFKLIDEGFIPGSQKQNYVLRKLLRICQNNGFIINHIYYEEEVERQKKILNKYNYLKNKHKNKSKEWWLSTHGIDIDSI